MIRLQPVSARLVCDVIRFACLMAMLAAIFLPYAEAAAQGHPATAPVVSGAQVIFSGEIGRKGPKTDIAAKAGVRMGLELIPEGSPAGTPVVLDVQILRPETQPPSPALSFQVAAALNAPALCAYEFAYDWEAIPGTWTMNVSHNGKELASQTFTVAAATSQEADSPQAAQADQAAEPEQPPTPAAPPVAVLPEEKPAEAAPAADNPPKDAAQNPEQKPAPIPEKDTPKTAGSAGFVPKTAAPEAARKDRPDQKPLAEKFPTPKPPAKKSPDQKKPAKGDSTQKAPTRANAGRQTFVLVSGVYPQEVRAQWMAALLKDRGVKAWVRKNANTAKPTWSVVVGWKDTREQALDAKRKLAPRAGALSIVPMTTGDLEKGLVRH